jgi:SAM-dependent methyltransferase
VVSPFNPYLKVEELENKGIYEKFASIYQRGPYIRFSQNLAENVLPQYLEDMDIHPVNVLDIACGEGSFAVAMAKRGYQVTGIDQSYEMISLAEERAQQENLSVQFLVEDMRSMPFEDKYDLVTCFFDSLNYLLTIKDLHQTFQCVYQALQAGGYFIFDMNTIYGLAVDWMRQESYIQNEADDFIEFHRHTYDYENQVATVEITVFMQQNGGLWQRFDEIHRERGYPVADLQFLLQETGFDLLGTYGHLSKRAELFATSPRVWFLAQKPASC